MSTHPRKTLDSGEELHNALLYFLNGATAYEQRKAIVYLEVQAERESEPLFRAVARILKHKLSVKSKRKARAFSS